jgi:carbon storage regulator CsrA
MWQSSPFFMEERTMLVLSRKVGERIVIGDGISVVVNRVAGNRVTLGIEAPDDVRIVRGELTSIVGQFDEPKESTSPPILIPIGVFDAHASNALLSRSAR